MIFDQGLGHLNFDQGILRKVAIAAGSESVPEGYHAPTNLSTIDSDLATGNIKSGETIFGKAGSSDVRDSTDADAEVGDVESGKTFYAGGGAKKTGTLTSPNPDHDAAAGDQGTGIGYAVTTGDNVQLAAGSDESCITDSVTVSLGACIEAFASLAAQVPAGAAYMKARLFVGGVQRAESGYIALAFTIYNLTASVEDNTSGAKALALEIHNYDSSTRALQYGGHCVFGGAVKAGAL